MNAVFIQVPGSIAISSRLRQLSESPPVSLMVQLAYRQPIGQSALLIVDYDEHGGMFDHVTPPLIRTDPTPEGQNIHAASR